jgi:hypothetical protein
MRAKANLNRVTKKRILSMYKKGNTMQEISKKLDIKLIWVMDVIKDSNIRIRKP